MDRGMRALTLSSIFLDIVRVKSSKFAVPLRFDGITSSYQATPSMRFVKTSDSSARKLSPVTGGGCDQA